MITKIFFQRSDTAIDKYYADREYNRLWNARISLAKSVEGAKQLREIKNQREAARKHDDEYEDLSIHHTDRPSTSLDIAQLLKNLPKLIITPDENSFTPLVEKSTSPGSVSNTTGTTNTPALFKW